MRYQHYKNGRVYTVLHHATMEATGADVVVYQNSEGKVWVRAVEDFYGMVDNEGNWVRRFNPQNTVLKD